MKKVKFPFISMSLCIVVWAVTIFLFFYLNTLPEKSQIFYFSLGYSIFLELLFFFYIGFLRMQKGGSSAAPVFNSVYGIIILTYIITGALILLGYNFILAGSVSFRILVTLLVIITTIAVVIAGLVFKTQSYTAETSSVEKGNAGKVEDIKEGFLRAEMRFRSIMKEKGIPYKSESAYGSGMEKMINAVKYLPANTLQHEENHQKFRGILQKIHSWIDSLSTSEMTPEQWDKQTIAFIEDTKTELDHIIKTTRL